MTNQPTERARIIPVTNTSETDRQVQREYRDRARKNMARMLTAQAGLTDLPRLTRVVEHVRDEDAPEEPLELRALRAVAHDWDDLCAMLGLRSTQPADPERPPGTCVQCGGDLPLMATSAGRTWQYTVREGACCSRKCRVDYLNRVPRPWLDADDRL